jgi:hypothetical protein
LKKLIILVFYTLVSYVIGYAQHLPREISWDGQSQKYIRLQSDPWITPGEKSDLTESPDYETTINWLRTLSDHSPHMTMQTIGKSSQNRKLWLVVVSKEGVITPSDLKELDRPTILFHAGIHSGEIDGKDAGMMFLRDIVLGRTSLLDNLNLLFIPVLNPDGHERSSAYNRINQRGPKKMGWRTNARNLNLNRDFTKAETPEIRALLHIFNYWPVDLYLDIHVTDGIDYQYDITYGFNHWNNYSPNISKWLQNVLRPFVDAKLTQQGHIPGPLIFAKNKKNPKDGIVSWTASPRYSNGYGDACHLPTILVENHALKSFRQRVLGTYVLLDAVSTLLAIKSDELLAEISKDKRRRPNKVIIETEWKATQLSPDSITFLGIDHRLFQSTVTGAEEIEWLGTPVQYTVPIYLAQPKFEILMPKNYWIPASRKDIINKLALHGIKMKILDQPRTLEVEINKIIKYTLSDETYEGRVQVNIDSLVSDRRVRYYPAGSAYISTDQPKGILASLLLEPQGADSFVKWGYFHEIFQRTEYVENYAVIPMAEQMLKDNPDLKKEFQIALQDSSFANDPVARIHWFYKRSPYYDKEYLVYPIGKEN